jgi:fibronectin type 3 domain-containing protein
MKKNIILIIMGLLFGFKMSHMNAQITSTSSNIKAQPVTDRTIVYEFKGTGISKPIIWGLDLAWLDEANIIRGSRFMGKENVSIIRSSFMPTQPLLNDAELQGDALTNTNKRIDIIKRNFGSNIRITLNSDHPSVNSYFSGNAVNWAKLIDITTAMHQDAGLDVVTVSPFNEPDYAATGQGTIQDFYNIILELKKNSRFDAIRISGGNTLNDDQALYWYNYLKPAGLTEGNTHQLAGSFDNYASFFQAVRANGDYATADEMHNVMDAVVGSEYGMQTGIWWGWAEYARGELCKATNGVRLGYAEHRPNWTAAAVYRSPQGKVQAFAGTSERQAVTTTYRYVSKDRAVYYDGQGPQREFVLEMPGGAVGSYQNGQTNAERVVNITYGEDIQPVINGRYKLVNRNSGKVMEVAAGSMDRGANIQQGTNTGGTYQQWDVTPVDSRIGGDFSYFTFLNANSAKSPDVLNFSLDNGANIIVWDNVKSANQQWYLDYAEDGWFYIRNRQSTNCLDVDNASMADGANIFQWEKNGSSNQQWRFLPISAPVEFVAPSLPSNLVATAQETSVKLSWTASPETDVVGYIIFRSETAGGEYNTIARNVTTTSFVDNTTLTGQKYFYKIKAVDQSLNRSVYSNEVSATASGDNDLVAQFQFDGNTLDSSVNLNDSATYGSVSYTQGKIGPEAITLNGANNFVQLPADIASHQEITVATWVFWNGGASWQRIFDFGNNQSENMFLSPSSGSSQLRFTINNGGVEQSLNASALPIGEWSHVAVTLSASGAKMYVNGKLVAESNTLNISPLDFKPVLNYIGRSQFSDPLLNGRIDDFRIYNYALEPEEIAKLALTNDNFVIETVGESCPNKNNGKITITANTDYTYSALVNGTPYPFTNKTLLLTNLEPKTYDICITVAEANMEQCYSIEIPESSAITSKTITASDKVLVEIESGTAPYQVVVNGVLQFETNKTNFDVNLSSGDLLEVKTAKDCEGVFAKKITLFDVVRAFPNPTTGQFEINLPTDDTTVTIAIYTVEAKLISKSNYQIENGKVRLNLENQPSGIYFVKIQSNPEETIQIIKK